MAPMTEEAAHDESAGFRAILQLRDMTLAIRNLPEPSKLSIIRASDSAKIALVTLQPLRTRAYQRSYGGENK